MNNVKKKRDFKATLKQKRWVVEYLKNGNAKGSALKVYPAVTSGTASQIGFRNLHSPQVRTYMAEILSQAGLDDKQIAQALAKIVTAGLEPQNLSKIKVQDTVRTLELASRLKDLFPAERKEIQRASLNLQLEGKTDQELIQILKEQQNELSQFKKMVESEEIRKLRQGVKVTDYAG